MTSTYPYTNSSGTLGYSGSTQTSYNSGQTVQGEYVQIDLGTQM